MTRTIASGFGVTVSGNVFSAHVVGSTYSTRAPSSLSHADSHVLTIARASFSYSPAAVSSRTSVARTGSTSDHPAGSVTLVGPFGDGDSTVLNRTRPALTSTTTAAVTGPPSAGRSVNVPPPPAVTPSGSFGSPTPR